MPKSNNNDQSRANRKKKILDNSESRIQKILEAKKEEQTVNEAGGSDGQPELQKENKAVKNDQPKLENNSDLENNSESEDKSESEGKSESDGKSDSGNNSELKKTSPSQVGRENLRSRVDGQKKTGQGNSKEPSADNDNELNEDALLVSAIPKDGKLNASYVYLYFVLGIAVRVFFESDLTYLVRQSALVPFGFVSAYQIITEYLIRWKFNASPFNWFRPLFTLLELSPLNECVGYCFLNMLFDMFTYAAVYLFSFIITHFIIASDMTTGIYETYVKGILGF